MPWIKQKQAGGAGAWRILPILAITSILIAVLLIWFYTHFTPQIVNKPTKANASPQPDALVPTAAPSTRSIPVTVGELPVAKVVAERIAATVAAAPEVNAPYEADAPTYAWSQPARGWSPPSYQVVRSHGGTSPAPAITYTAPAFQPTAPPLATAWGAPPDVSPSNAIVPVANTARSQSIGSQRTPGIVPTASGTTVNPATMGTAEPAVYGYTVNTTPALDVGLQVGAGRFYAAGYTGTNAKVANIEGGTAWRGHQTLDWMTLDTNIFWAAGALNETANPSPPTGSQNTSMHSHATATSMNIAGKAPGNLTTNLGFYRGVAYGIADGNFYSGNMANNIQTSTFNFQFAAVREIYYRAIVQGVGAGNTTNSANRVDVVSSSWGAQSSASNLDRQAKIIDAVAYEGNQTRGSTIVISTGNSGPGSNTVGTPAAGFNSIAVGALGELATDQPSGSVFGTPVYNAATTFSSRGASRYNQPANASDLTGTDMGDVRARVDIAAPGFQMALATYTYSATNPGGSNPSAFSVTQGTSFSAPTVTGGVALLADYARSPQGLSDATYAADGRLIKAVLINSATKTAGWNNGQSWNGSQWSTTQGLDYVTGGGALNLDQAFNQYANVTGNTITQLMNPTEAASYNVLGTGWARASITRPDTNITANADFVLGNPLTKHTEINATLNWFVNRTSAADGSAADVAFHNLDLEIWRADGSGNPVTRVGQSTANYNNTEHLSFLVPEDGQYLVRVIRPGDDSNGTYYTFGESNASLNTDVFGLAWMSRPSLVSNSSATLNSGTQTHANVLIAPDTNGSSLTVSGSSTRLNVLNQLIIGGTDRGATGGGVSGTFTVSNGASVDVSNRLQVFSGSSISLSGSTLTGGMLTLNGSASLTASGTSMMRFSEINLPGNLTVPASTELTIQSYRSSTGANTGRLNFSGSSPTIDVADGSNLRIHSLITNPSNTGLTKTGNGILYFSPSWYYSSSGTPIPEPQLYTGGTYINQGSLVLQGSGALPVGGDVTVAPGATFYLLNGSNTSSTAIGTLSLGTATSSTGGALSIQSNVNLNYYMGNLSINGGSVWYAGSNDGFSLHLTGISSGANSPAVSILSSGTARITNRSFSPANIAVSNATPEVGLEIGIILSNAGNNTTFHKTGAGTLRLTNSANTANLEVRQGRLRIDSTTLAPLGSGTLRLDGATFPNRGTLTYGNTTNDGATSKAITVGPGDGAIEVPTAARTLTLNNGVNYTGAFFHKDGPGTLVVNASNTGDDTSVLSVNQGTLRLGNSSNLPNPGSVRLNGGTLSTIGVSSGFTDNVGFLEVPTNSTLALGSNPHTILFGGINNLEDTGTLTITGWQGDAFQSGTGGKVQFTGIGSNPNTTYSDFLDSVQFQNYGLGEASFLLISGSTFELVLAPVPEPGAVLAIAAGAFAIGNWVRRRRPTLTEPCINSKA